MATLASMLFALALPAAYSKDFIFGLGWCAELKLSLKSHLLLNRRSTTFEIKRSARAGARAAGRKSLQPLHKLPHCRLQFLSTGTALDFASSKLERIADTCGNSLGFVHTNLIGHTQTLLHFLLSWPDRLLKDLREKPFILDYDLLL